ncbi:acyltransferase family protein [Agromyces cerinus]|uniref:Peptidoglycan/LPS O-acetylase OafA/YrhL, contains acyltransferase and SGNH-hydrolase domains n=1 Tax=Agromyces cerinus subsp. cerinus TaxID=232089 RepID=A0A1N6DIJ4_9MICO|nr:acyltransferase [Agromyces cerinus]SIN70600.1 Peptidoglycan/LPS O-acetylase OafA/YrhL, contains acyltransferase and SGNH-hydrolase domains [Agromyces cerinus subsp. cerinus]
MSDGLNGHRNSLGFLRLFMAVLVIFSHAFILGGWGHDPVGRLTHQQESAGGFAVVAFFAMSGYLVTQSGAATDVVQFLWRRFLRIFPGFWVVLLLTAFVVGPLMWKLHYGQSLGSYFSGDTDGGPLDYVARNFDLTIEQLGIHSLFSDGPFGESTGGRSSVNGSLWTLAYEWRAYLFIAVLVLFGGVRKLRFVALAAVLLLAIGLAAGTFASPAPSSPLPFVDAKFAKVALAFAVGSCLSAFSDRVPLDDRLGWFSWLVVAASLLQGGWLVAGVIALPYALLWTAVRLPAVFQKIGARNDYSYGVYIYAFLIQQVTVAIGWNSFGYVPWVAATLALTFAAAWASWHLVERPALRLKNRGPGLGLAHWRSRLSSISQTSSHRKSGRFGGSSDASSGASQRAVEL